jgi:excisionase family DNA binding protein
MRTTPTLGQIADLPVVLDLESAGRLLGIGRTTAYEMARAGRFPCRTIRVGAKWRVPTAELLALLGLSHEPENERPLPWQPPQSSHICSPQINGSLDKDLT